MSELQKIASGYAECEIEVKKSRFMAFAGPAESREQALDFLAKIRSEYADAGHHCWAYLLGGAEAPTSAGMNDDGEPNGTAGKPILNVLQHKAIGNVMLVVVRYFGGIKLGAGGLVRAYSQAAEEVMQRLPARVHVAQSQWNIILDFSLEQHLRHFLSELGGTVVDIQYTQDVTASISLPTENDDKLETFCAQHQLNCKRSID